MYLDLTIIHLLFTDTQLQGENYCQITQERLPKRVQAVLKNKGGCTKYWLSTLIKLYKFCFCLKYLHAFLHVFQYMPC